MTRLPHSHAQANEWKAEGGQGSGQADALEMTTNRKKGYAGPADLLCTLRPEDAAF